MRAYAQLRSNQIVVLAMRVWLRRLPQIHLVAALALAPLLVVPELFDTEPVPLIDPLSEDPALFGFFGLFATAWAVAADFLNPTEGLLLSLTIVYVSQFVVSILVARDAYRHLTGHAPRCGPLACVSLGLFALGGLAVFVILDAVTVAAFASASPLPLLLLLATTIGELYVGSACWLALPAAAVEGRSLFSAVGRGLILSQGSRFQIGAVIAMLGLLNVVVIIPVLVLAGVDERWRFAWVLAMLLVLTFRACVLAAAYQEACDRKEGPGVEEVSKVFA